LAFDKRISFYRLGTSKRSAVEAAHTGKVHTMPSIRELLETGVAAYFAADYLKDAIEYVAPFVLSFVQ